jgi:hypothetical protein
MSGPRYDLVPHIGTPPVPPPIAPPPPPPEVAEPGEYVPDKRFFRRSPLLCFIATFAVLWALGKILRWY